MRTIGNQFIACTMDKGTTKWIGFAYCLVDDPFDAMCFDYEHEALRVCRELQSKHGSRWHVTTFRDTLDMRNSMANVLKFYGDMKNAG